MEIVKEIVREVVRGDKHNLRKPANCKAQISTMCRVDNWFGDFSGCVCHLEQLHAQFPFLFPIVFGINQYDETWIFCTFQSVNPKFLHQFHVFFSLLYSISHLQTRCACFLKGLICFDGRQFWFIHIGFFLTLFTNRALCRSFVPCSIHTYTPFSNTFLNKVQWLKSRNLCTVTEKKAAYEWKVELCVYLQWRRQGRSGHWVRKIPANQNTGNIEGNSVFVHVCSYTCIFNIHVCSFWFCTVYVYWYSTVTSLQWLN